MILKFGLSCVDHVKAHYVSHIKTIIMVHFVNHIK